MSPSRVAACETLSFDEKCKPRSCSAVLRRWYVPLVRRMLSEAEDCDGVVPLVGAHPEPLFAVYTKRLAAPMRAALAAGRRRVRDGFGPCAVRFLPLAEAGWLRNVNTMEEYREVSGGR